MILILDLRAGEKLSLPRTHAPVPPNFYYACNALNSIICMLRVGAFRV